MRNERSLAAGHANDAITQQFRQALWEWSPHALTGGVSRERGRHGELSLVLSLVRRLLVLALGALLVVPVPSRADGPSADVVVSADAHFTLYGRDKASYLVDVVAEDSEAGTRLGAGTVTVTVRRCLSFSCPQRTRWVGALPAGSFAVAQDLSSAALTTTLFGKPLDVRWGAPKTQALPGYDADPGTPRLGVRVYEVLQPHGSVMGRRCGSQDGLVARGALVTSGPVVDKPLPKVLPRAGRRAGLRTLAA